MSHSEHIKVLGVEASVRASGQSHRIMAMIEASQGLEQTSEFVYNLASEGVMANSEGMLITALSGARREGAEVDIIYLHDKPNLIHGDPSSGLIGDYLDDYHGLVISTPVYFGDRSCYTEWLFNSLATQTGLDLPLDGRTVGFLSVGAKRNGGQETANVFGLYDAQSMGAVIVGNGPPTSQYGGTGWAGDKGRILDDDFGLKTAFGTGRRVAQVAGVQALDLKGLPPQEVTIAVLKFQQSEYLAQRLATAIQDLGQRAEVVDVSQRLVKRCLACRICPHPDTKGQDYRCIIDDDMQRLYEQLIGIDGLVFVADLDHAFDGMNNYQLFMERTRWVRRYHFLWGNLAVGIAVCERPNTLSAFPLRALSSSLRHNTFLVGPFYRLFRMGDQVMENLPVSRMAERLVAAARKAKYYREVVLGGQSMDHYEAVGYDRRALQI